MLDDVEAVLAEAATGIGEVVALYEKDLQNQEVSPALRAKIKNILENQRSALEYLAHALTAAYGNSGRRTSYPLAGTAADFWTSLDKQMSGVRKKRPDIAALIEKHQPYQTGCQWLAHLRDLTNENKHRRLSPQSRQVKVSTRVSNASGSVQWGNGIVFRGNVSVMGVPIDPRTQMPVPSARVQVDRIEYVDWIFEKPRQSARAVLAEIQFGVNALVSEIRLTAGL